MAEQAPTTRRSFLSSAALLTASAAATGALTTLAVSAEPQLTGEALAYEQAHKLAATMSGPEFENMDGFTMTVKTNSPDQPIWITKDVAPLASMPALSRAKYHAHQAALAMNEINPGKWQVTVDSEDALVLVHLQHEWTYVPTDIPGMTTPR